MDTGKVYHHPPIVHYAKLSKDGQAVSLNFRDYSSALSAHKFIQPEKIIFHTYSDMSGKYWDMIKGVEIVLNKIPCIRKFGDKAPAWIQHHADFVKLSALYKYGGVGLDFDVIIVNGTRLKQEQRTSECVLAFEGEYVNGGFYSCIANYSLVAYWLEGYEKDYQPRKWLHNISYRPLNLLLDKKSSVCYNVYVDKTISINPGFGKQRQWLGRDVQWRTKTAAHYFIKRGIPNDDERLLQADHSLGDLLRYVHEA